MSSVKKILCLCLCLLLLLPSAALAGDNASVRVLLRRLALADRADLTLSGRYLARSAEGAELLLPENAKFTVQLRKKQLVLFSGGLSVAMGTSLTLLRQEGEQEPGITFNLQSGFYPGDLSLSVEEDSLVPVLTLPLETYLKGVVPYEMGDGFPLEALKAQAVCARTYALSRMNAKSAWDVVDTTNDQVFKGIPPDSPVSSRAVDETAGLVLTWGKELITAWYGASNGGQTELPQHVWGGKAPGCFTMVDDPWDTENPDALTRTCILNRDGTDLSPAFVKLLRKAALADPENQGFVPEEADFSISRLTSLTLTDPRYAAPSRLMTRLQVTFEAAPRRNSSVPADPGKEVDLDITDILPTVPFTVSLELFPETLIALGLSISGADNEILTLKETENAFVLTSGRFGHGVGMSQRGAQQMARAGKKTFQEILAFYYPGAKLKRYTGEATPVPTPDPVLARDPGPVPTATPRPTLMPVTEALPEGAWLASVEHIDEDSSLNLRAEPSPGAVILMRLFCHQKLIVLEESDVPGWVHVITDAIEGFVMRSFLEEVREK